MLLLVTGSCGLIGSECVTFFDKLGYDIVGIDNNMRQEYFGKDGDTSWNLKRLQKIAHRYTHLNIDVRDREQLAKIFSKLPFDAIVHAAAQPSHDLAASNTFLDFDVNAVGTLNLLEATQKFRPNAVFCFLSTNKVYGTAPNELPLVELETRYDYALQEHFAGISESLRTDQSLHSLFGASKLSADILVQEYGHYFALKTACFRGGCLTGPMHSAVELHGFLAYLVKCIKQKRQYNVYGHKGKQVRDNIHAYDVCQALHAFMQGPRTGEVYNIGGGRANSISVIEAISKVEEITGLQLTHQYIDQPRKGDHVCYISNTSKLSQHYPAWKITRSLNDILMELCSTIL